MTSEEITLSAPEVVEKHFGPGPHPGTGTPQKVHGGGGRASLVTPFLNRATPGSYFHNRLKEWAEKSNDEILERAMTIWRSGFIESSNMRAIIDGREPAPAYKDDLLMEMFANSIAEGVRTAPVQAEMWRMDMRLGFAGEVPKVGQVIRSGAWALATERFEAEEFRLRFEGMGFARSDVEGAVLMRFVNTRVLMFPDGREGIAIGPVRVTKVDPTIPMIDVVPEPVIEKHYGPGPHPGTGTSQKVHGGGGAGVATSAFRMFHPDLVHTGDPGQVFPDMVDREVEVAGLPWPSKVTVRWMGMEGGDPDLELSDEMREALEGVPPELWEAANNPKVVVVNDTQLFGYVWDTNDPFQTPVPLEGLGLYMLPDSFGMPDNGMLSEPDGGHVLYLTGRERTDLDLELNPGGMKHTIAHELGHAVTLPRMFPDMGEKVLMTNTAQLATILMFQDDLPMVLRSSVDPQTGFGEVDPWFYPRLVAQDRPGQLYGEFAAEAFAHMARGNRDVVNATDFAITKMRLPNPSGSEDHVESSEFAASFTDDGFTDITDYLDSFFDGEVPLTKRVNPVAVFGGHCATQDLLAWVEQRREEGMNVEKHFGPGPHPGTGTPQDVHGKRGRTKGKDDTPKLRASLTILDDEGAPINQWQQKDGKKWTPEFHAWVMRLSDSDASADLDLAMDLFAERRARTKAFNTKFDDLISTGAITPEEARKQGWSDVNWQGGGPQDLPETLFHTTTATAAVLKEGLKSRDELGGITGLGGGPSSTISFTTERAIAQDILDSMRFRHSLLNGDTTMFDLIRQAKAGTGADRSWYDEKTMGAQARHNVEWSQETRAIHILPSEAPAKLRFLPDRVVPGTIRPVGEPLVGGDGKNRWNRWEGQRIPTGRTEALGDYHENWSMRRETQGGPLDPLYWGTKDTAFAALDSSDFSVMEFSAKPGARGYPVSSLGEWRILNAEAVELSK